MLDLSVRLGMPGFDLEVDLVADVGITVVFGRSGSGKTTLMNVIAGLQSPARGYVRLSGTTVYDTATSVNVSAHNRAVGYVFQNPRLFPHMNVHGNLAYGLKRSQSGRRRDDIEKAMEESLMEVLPRLEKRTHYLATLANIATLLGLLGTIIGLIRAFTAVSNANPADKADLLSASISVAMNTTAFGLMVAIPLLLVHALLQTKTNQLVDSLEMATVKFLNAVTERSLKAGA